LEYFKMQKPTSTRTTVTGVKKLPLFAKNDKMSLEKVPKTYPAGFIGIELEVCGTALPTFTHREDWYPGPGKKPVWLTTPDHSLAADGREYVMSEPGNPATVEALLKDWTKQTTTTKFRDDISASTHVHISLGGMTWRQVLSVLATAYMLEPFLLNIVREDRQYNLFCLPQEVCAGSMHDMSLLFEQYGRLDQTDGNERYSGINTAAIRRYGSLEFRHKEALTDAEEIKTWALLIRQIVMAGSELHISEIGTSYYANPPKKFLETIFGSANAVKEFLEVTETDTMTDDELRKLLATNSKTIPAFYGACLKRKRKYIEAHPTAKPAPKRKTTAEETIQHHNLRMNPIRPAPNTAFLVDDIGIPRPITTTTR
jgi:hypothetical protein